MWRDRRAFVPGTRGRGSASRAGPRGHAFRFGKGNRFAGDDGPGRISVRETAGRWVSVAIFAEDIRLLRPLCGKRATLPWALSEIQAARGSRNGWIHFHGAGARSETALRADVHPRV